MLHRFKYSDNRLVIKSRMTVLLQGFSSPTKSKEGGDSLGEVAKLVWLHRRNQLCFWITILLLPLVIINTCFVYFNYIAKIPPNSSLSNLNSNSNFNSSSYARSISQPGSESESVILPLPPQDFPSNSEGACDLTKGQWIPEDSPPLYTNGTCKYIQLLQNCMRNGRPDTGFLHWRWKPNDCELPLFDPTLFLQLVRSKKLLFFGDSLARNHMQSLLCSLSQVEDPQKTYSREDKDVKWFFPTYNFTLAIVWSPFLVRHVKVRDDPLLFNLHLDAPHRAWSSTLTEYDFSVFSASQWFFRPSVYSKNNTVIGCNEYSGQNYTAMYFMDAFHSALKTTLKTIGALQGYRGTTFLRTASVEHFEHGTWSTGGKCNRTVPFPADLNNQTKDVLPWLPQTVNEIQVDEYKKFVAEGSENGSKLKLLDVTYSAFLRPDGHPGPYRIFRPFSSQDGQNAHVQNDCLHWCLPGPVDMWNQLLIEALKD